MSKRFLSALILFISISLVSTTAFAYDTNCTTDSASNASYNHRLIEIRYLIGAFAQDSELDMRTSKVFLIDGQTATNMLKNKYDPLTGFKGEEQLCKDIKDLKRPGAMAIYVSHNTYGNFIITLSEEPYNNGDFHLKWKGHEWMVSPDFTPTGSDMCEFGTDGQIAYNPEAVCWCIDDPEGCGWCEACPDPRAESKPNLSDFAEYPTDMLTLDSFDTNTQLPLWDNPYYPCPICTL